MNEEIRLTLIELFYIKDCVTKQYWEYKKSNEDQVVLKNILSASDKLQKAYVDKTKGKANITFRIVQVEE